jgi:hypothetical protein
MMPRRMLTRIEADSNDLTLSSGLELVYEFSHLFLPYFHTDMYYVPSVLFLQLLEMFDLWHWLSVLHP